MSVHASIPATLPPCEAWTAIAADGACADVMLQRPVGDTNRLLYWLPALGVAAKHYLPLAQALAEQGVAVAIHEWRGIGSSDRRASRREDWGYRELLDSDLPAGVAVIRARVPHARFYLGGHSLGGQLATLYASLHPGRAAGLLAVASGAPYWRQFPQGRLLWAAYALAPWLARLVGYLPGRRIGFGGNEARQLIDDWARTGRTGRYAAVGMDTDLEAALGQLDLPVLGLRMQDDWLVPEASLSWLLAKMPRGAHLRQLITASELGADRADHFGWMKAPRPIATHIAAWLDAQPTR